MAKNTHAYFARTDNLLKGHPDGLRILAGSVRVRECSFPYASRYFTSSSVTGLLAK